MGNGRALEPCDSRRRLVRRCGELPFGGSRRLPARQSQPLPRLSCVPSGWQVAEAGSHSSEGEGTEPKPNDFRAGAVEILEVNSDRIFVILQLGFCDFTITFFTSQSLHDNKSVSPNFFQINKVYYIDIYYLMSIEALFYFICFFLV